MINITKILSAVPKNLVRVSKADIRCLATQAATKSAVRENAEEKTYSNSFAMNLFRGELETSQLFPYPWPLNEDQIDTVKMLVGPAEKFFMEVNDAAKNDENESIDEKTMKELHELGVLSLQVPTEYGGLGLNNTQYARLAEIISHDLGVGTMLGAHQSIGFKGILLFGTPEQKAKYLTKVCDGDIAAFCLTEPTCGSDASAIRSRAIESSDKSHYILNGSKIWISNGGIAKILTVFAKVPVKNPETGEVKEKMTAFIVERAFPGVTSGPPEHKMGIRGSNTTEVFFEDVKIPAENVLGEVGQGFKIAMNILNNGRFGMAAVLSGTMRNCIKKAVEHATQRVQFGKTLENYGSIQEKLARMSMLHYVTESLYGMICGNMDLGSEEYHLETAISKCFSSESAWWVCDEAIQIMGGMGYMKSTGLERTLRDLRIFRIYEGANDILRLFVVLTGIQYAGSHLKELQKALKNPTANLGLIAEEAAKRATRAIGLRSPPSLSHLVHPNLAESATLCSKSVEAFGQAVEGALIKYGRDIINEQFILNRFAQAATDTYTMAVVLSRATMSANQNRPSVEHEFLMANTWCAEASNRVAYNLKVIESAKHLQTFANLQQISRNVCEAGGIVQQNPLGF